MTNYLVFLTSGAVVAITAWERWEDNGQLTFWDQDKNIVAKFNLAGICGWSKASKLETPAQANAVPHVTTGRMQ